METHIYFTMYGDSYIGYNIWSIIYRVKCMETHVKVAMYGES